MFKWDFQNWLLISRVKLWEWSQVNGLFRALLLDQKVGRLKIQEIGFLSMRTQGCADALEDFHTWFKIEANNQAIFRLFFKNF